MRGTEIYFRPSLGRHSHCFLFCFSQAAPCRGLSTEWEPGARSPRARIRSPRGRICSPLPILHFGADPAPSQGYSRAHLEENSATSWWCDGPLPKDLLSCAWLSAAGQSSLGTNYRNHFPKRPLLTEFPPVRAREFISINSTAASVKLRSPSEAPTPPLPTILFLFF